LKAVIKDVKSQLKSPLGDRRPHALLRFKAIGRAGEEVILEDSSGERLVLAEDHHPGEPTTLPLLPLLPPNVLRNQSVVVRFHHDLDAQKLRAKPLSLVTETEVIRLTF
jgi:hypothetical protein